MFHSQDGLFFERRIGAPCPGYSWQEQIDKFFKIQVVVTEPDKATVINEKWEIKEEYRQRVIFQTLLDVNTLASIMASMSVRGENSETFEEALKFLKREK